MSCYECYEHQPVLPTPPFLRFPRPIQLEPLHLRSNGPHPRRPIGRPGLLNLTLHMLDCQKTRHIFRCFLLASSPGFAFSAIPSSAQVCLLCSQYKAIVWEQIRSTFRSRYVCVNYGIKGFAPCRSQIHFTLSSSIQFPNSRH